MRKIVKLLMLLILLSLFTGNAYSQYSEFNNKGKDFWLSFLPNYINDPRNDDRVMLFMAAEEPTNVTIEYFNRDRNRIETRNITISDPSKIEVFWEVNEDFSLKGFQYPSESPVNNQTSEISRQYFHITSDKDIVVYAHSEALTTSDAFMVLPTKSLGNEYRIMTYNSDGYNGFSNSTPSQFVIVATEQGTEVEITTPCPTYPDMQRDFSFLLDKGETFLVQADMTTAEDHDLTGTYIKANKNIAVFAGHKRATIPKGNYSNPSRDFLCEQMPSISKWGKSAIIIPFPRLNEQNSNKDLYRVIAAEDQTSIYKNGQLDKIINKDDIYENFINQDESTIITSDKPILAAVFKKTSNPSYSTSQYDGDPLMAIIPPFEQFERKYKAINISHENRYNEHYLMIVSRKFNIGKITVDGTAISENEFEQINNSEFYYCQYRVSAGQHDLEAPFPFGVYICGFGPAASYGYLGGMAFNELDASPPQIFAEEECFKVKGFTSDSLDGDWGLHTVHAPASEQKNVTVVTSINNTNKFIHDFEATLDDIYLDGEFIIEAVDSSGQYAILQQKIPGFTVTANQNDIANPIVIDIYLAENETDSESIEFFNYGQFKQKIIDIYIKNAASPINLLGNRQFEIDPLQTENITLEFNSQVGGKYTEELVIVGECGERSVVLINLTIFKDEKAPVVSKFTDECKENINIYISDSTNTDFGLDEYTIDYKENLRIVNEYNNGVTARIDFVVEDLFEDAMYTITAKDSVGNTSTISDTIPGMTVTFDRVDTDSIYNFEEQTIGYQNCMNFTLHNYGKYPKVFEDARLIFNTNFSIPQAQFPLVIEPNEKVDLLICFEASSVEEKRLWDSIVFKFNCVQIGALVEGYPVEDEREGTSNCDVDVQITTGEVPKNYYLMPTYPNPIIKDMEVFFGLKEDGYAELKVFNTHGELVKTIMQGEMKAGKYDCKVDAKDLRQGAYIIRLITPHANISQKFVKVE